MANSINPLSPRNIWHLTAQPLAVQDKSFEFIAHDSLAKPIMERQRLIRSHASRGKRRKKRGPVMSWILQQHGQPVQVDDAYTSIPRQVGSDFSFLELPVELQPYMQRDIAQGMFQGLSEKSLLAYKTDTWK
jgi:hypothetical protein